ncbi:hypothetical protein BDZ89DRAFT_1144871 [Hymenopellis radicata]|nr:hypothetical protein BDZ89DRAFT_1144871 [Hymenopellis radicata]
MTAAEHQADRNSSNKHNDKYRSGNRMRLLQEAHTRRHSDPEKPKRVRRATLKRPSDYAAADIVQHVLFNQEKKSGKLSKKTQEEDARHEKYLRDRERYAMTMSRRTRAGNEFSPYALAPAIICRDVRVADLLRRQMAEIDAEGDSTDDEFGDDDSEGDVDADGDAAVSYHEEMLSTIQGSIDTPASSSSHCSHPSSSPPSLHALPNPPPSTRLDPVPNTPARPQASHSPSRHTLHVARPCGPGQRPQAPRTVPNARHASEGIRVRERSAPVPSPDTTLLATPQWILRLSPEASVFPRRCASIDEDAFPAPAAGVGYGGGEEHPVNRVMSKSVRGFMDKILSSHLVRRLAGWVNCLFEAHNPTMFNAYAANLAAILERDKSLRRNFSNSVFALLTVNAGRRTITDPHRDRANCPPGWCPVSAFGNYDPTQGGKWFWRSSS